SGDSKKVIYNAGSMVTL
nr:glutathione transferase homolog {N-terminal} [Spiroplasma melliferum, A56, Peptide Partial, 17 aa] [Spiroplasma melliferum]